MSEGKKYKAKPFGPLRQVYNIDINCMCVRTHTHAVCAFTKKRKKYYLWNA